MPQGLFGELLIGDREKIRQGLDHDDFAPQAAPDTAELESDDAGADDAQPFRHGIEVEGAPGIDDALAVKRRGAQLHGRRTAGQNDVLCPQLAPRAVQGRELDPLARQQLAVAL